MLELGRDRGAVAADLHHGAAPLEDGVAVLVEKGVAEREPRDALVGGVRRKEAHGRGRGQQLGARVERRRHGRARRRPKGEQLVGKAVEALVVAHGKAERVGVGGVRRRRRLRKAEVRRGQPVGRARLEVELAVESEQRRAVVVAALDVIVGVREARAHVLLSLGAVEDHSDVLAALLVGARRVKRVAVHGERLVQALREDAHARADRVGSHDAVEAQEQLQVLRRRAQTDEGDRVVGAARDAEAAHVSVGVDALPQALGALVVARRGGERQHAGEHKQEHRHHKRGAERLPRGLLFAVRLDPRDAALGVPRVAVAVAGRLRKQHSLNARTPGPPPSQRAL